jgi:hypothetical protein
VPRLPHIESIKFMEPTLTADQLSFIMQRLLRLNPARPDLALRTFGRRRRHFQLMQQPPPIPSNSAPATPQPPETNFTISMNNRPQPRLSLSLIASLPYCVCCLCGQDHSTPDCPQPSPQQPNPPHVCNLYSTYDDDPAEDPVPNSLALPEHTWRALHWDVWNSQDPLDPIPPPNAAQSPVTSLSPPSPAARKRRHLPTSRKRNRNTADPSQPTITQFFSAVSTPPSPHLSTTTPTSEIAVGPGSPQVPHD